MNLEETIALIECLKAAGAVHFKSHDFEVQLRRGKVAKVVTPKPKRQAPLFPEAPAAEPAHNEANTKRAESLLDLLKGKDEQLMDVIFPDGAGG